MMSNPGMRLTRQGEEILAKGLEGKTITFNRVALGDGEFDYETETVYSLVEMRHWVMDLTIVSKKNVGNGHFVLRGRGDNRNLTQGFWAREMCIFALDPDDGREVLYSYRNAGHEASFIPSNAAPVIHDIDIGFTTVVQDAPNIEVVVNSDFAYTSQDEFDEHIAAVHPHPNTPNHYNDVTAATKLWATDEDNHLHQISVANLKSQLAGSEKTVNEDNFIIFKSRAELGLEANLLIVEDFTEPSTADEFKVKVTSSAKNGSLIGVESADGLLQGAEYYITDGVKQERIVIESIIFNESGVHVKISHGLDNGYEGALLCRTTAKLQGGVMRGAIEAQGFAWRPSELFKGIEANRTRELELETYADKRLNFEITGYGVLSSDGFFTLG